MLEFFKKLATTDETAAQSNSVAVDMQLHGVERSSFLSASGELKPAVATLLAQYGVETGGSPDTILTAMKLLWWGERRGLSNATVARYSDFPPEERRLLLEDIGHVGRIDAPAVEYSHALLMGGTLGWVRDRMENLVAQWDAGVRFKTLVMLGADRPLDLDHSESKAALLTPPSTGLRFKPDWKLHSGVEYKDEFDMMRLVYEQSVLPEAWGSVVPVVWVKSLAENGRYPNTEKTVVDFLRADRSQSFGYVLSASSQPFVHYQNLVTAAVFAEANVPAAGFIATGYGSGLEPSSIYREYIYLDQMIRRFEYELRYKTSDGNSNIIS